jgi:hypothetical protein
MDLSKIYILIAIVALAIIAVAVVFVRGKKPEEMSRLSQIAFIFIFAGIIFGSGESRFLGYGLMTSGIILALVDIIKKFKK